MIKNFSFDSVTLESRFHHNKNKSLEGATNAPGVENFFKRSLNHIRVSSSSRQTIIPEKSESTIGHSSTDETVNLSSTGGGGGGGKNSQRSQTSFIIGKKNRENNKKPLSTFFADKKNTLTLKLSLGDKLHRLELNIMGRNTGWLRDQISTLFMGPDPSVLLPQFWLVSKEENYLLDEFLHSRERSLSCLKDRTLDIEILKQNSSQLGGID